MTASEHMVECLWQTKQEVEGESRVKFVPLVIIPSGQLKDYMANISMGLKTKKSQDSKTSH